MNTDQIPAAAAFYPPSSRDVSLRKRLLQMSGKASFSSNVDKADFHAMLNEVVRLGEEAAQLNANLIRLLDKVAYSYAVNYDKVPENVREAVSRASLGEPFAHLLAPNAGPSNKS